MSRPVKRRFGMFTGTVLTCYRMSCALLTRRTPLCHPICSPKMNWGRRRLAYDCQPGDDPPIMFLPGFNSNMLGTKAQCLAGYAKAQGRAFIGFDYSGHGQSSGEFADGTIGLWLDDTLAVLDHLVVEPVILIGSSMGGWLMLHAAMQRPAKIAALIGVASAPDFPIRMQERLTTSQYDSLRQNGHTALPSSYGDDLVITQKFLDEARNHFLLQQPIPIHCPCHLLHGQEDPDVDWTTSMALASQLATPHVTIELIKDGDHRLSRESDLRRMIAAVERLSNRSARDES